MGDGCDESSPRQEIAVVDTDPCLLDAFLRLTELLKPEAKFPSEQAVLAPSLSGNYIIACFRARWAIGFG
jgi:hypothetical protein